MIVHVTRFILVSVGVISGLAIMRMADWVAITGLPENLLSLVSVVLGWSIGYVIGGIVGRELNRTILELENRLSRLSAMDLALSATGLLIGLLASLIIAWPLRLVEPAWMAVLLAVSISLLFGYVSVRVALLKRAEVARIFSGKTGLSAADASREKMLLLDTSALIDGRFVELHSMGYLDYWLRVPRFVLAELQTLADSADDIKRARGRRGLDLLARLHDTERVVEVFEADMPDLTDTDSKLMELALETGAAILTLDMNLTKVARIRGIEVLNINEIALALRPSYLPGEEIKVRLVKAGKEQDQGVGYLDDGTMVIAIDSADFIGEEIVAQVTSVLQTAGGRMMFVQRRAAAQAAGGSIDQ